MISPSPHTLTEQAGQHLPRPQAALVRRLGQTRPRPQVVALVFLKRGLQRVHGGRQGRKGLQGDAGVLVYRCAVRKSYGALRPQVKPLQTQSASREGGYRAPHWVLTKSPSVAQGLSDCSVNIAYKCHSTRAMYGVIMSSCNAVWSAWVQV